MTVAARGWSPGRGAGTAAGVLLLLVAGLGGGPSCTPDLSLSGEVRIPCGAGRPCPEEFFCSEAVGRCVKAAGADTEPPALLEESVRIAPEVAGRDVEVQVSFEVTEVLELPRR